MIESSLYRFVESCLFGILEAKLKISRLLQISKVIVRHLHEQNYNNLWKIQNNTKNIHQGNTQHYLAISHGSAQHIISQYYQRHATWHKYRAGSTIWQYSHLLESGTVYLANQQSYFNPVTSINSKIEGISCGWHHGIAWDHRQVYSWGYSKEGALGYESTTHKHISKIPLLLEKNQNVEWGVCGPRNTVIKLTKIIVGFGDNSYGQLGLLVRKSYNLPEILKVYNSKGQLSKNIIKQVAVGEDKILMLDIRGDVYGAGELSNFACENRGLTGFYQIGLDTNDTIQYISASANITAFLTNQSTLVYTNGNKSSLIYNTKLNKVYSGNDYVIGIGQQQELYAWGKIPSTSTNHYHNLTIIDFQLDIIDNCQLLLNSSNEYIGIVYSSHQPPQDQPQQPQQQKVQVQQTHKKVTLLQQQIELYKQQLKEKQEQCQQYKKIISNMQSTQQYQQIISLQQTIIQKLTNQNQQIKQSQDSQQEIYVEGSLENIGRYLMELKYVLEDD